MRVRGSGRSPCAPPACPSPALPRIPLQDAALLHALLAPKELAAVDALGGPRAPAVPVGAQRVAGQALTHCSERKESEGTLREAQVEVKQGKRLWGGSGWEGWDRAWAMQGERSSEIPGTEREGRGGSPRQ